MNESIYNQLNQTAPEQQKPALAFYLREQLDRYNSTPSDGRAIAYEIAGLLSTELAQSLDSGDPYLEILLLAGRLELPIEHQGSATWEQLAERIRALPN